VAPAGIVEAPLRHSGHASLARGPIASGNACQLVRRAAVTRALRLSGVYSFIARPYKKAMGDGPQAETATIFRLKTRAQWKETTVPEQHVTHGPVLRIVRHIVSPQRQGDDAPSLVPTPLRVRLIDQVVADR